MDIGVKYCGGCNPRYERKNILERLRREYDGITIHLVKEDEIYDLIIVLCGCSSCCVNHENIKGKKGKLILSSEKDYNKLIQFIEG
ncbi:hypothetical protein GCM10008905_14500 [Clostridium malenominatum]|uniref:Uncharacterized protein n=1 Tax=Clostridium malenominatum TaxID=1539 RepID=A0ABN1IWA2_9CLOT